MITDMSFQQQQGNLEFLYPLLLLADPSREMIDQYVHHSDVITAHIRFELIGLYVLLPTSQQSAEIKNLAVIPEFQGKGVGQRLLLHAIDRARKNGFKKLTIATGNSSLLQLYLYQKMGFSITETKIDFFPENYPEPIFENGIECRDMIILSKTLN